MQTFAMMKKPWQTKFGSRIVTERRTTMEMRYGIERMGIRAVNEQWRVIGIYYSAGLNNPTSFLKPTSQLPFVFSHTFIFHTTPQLKYDV